jgi:hypothetical protein
MLGYGKKRILSHNSLQSYKKERLPHKDWQLKINSYFCKAKFFTPKCNIWEGLT